MPILLWIFCNNPHVPCFRRSRMETGSYVHEVHRLDPLINQHRSKVVKNSSDHLYQLIYFCRHCILNTNRYEWNFLHRSLGLVCSVWIIFVGFCLSLLSVVSALLAFSWFKSQNCFLFSIWATHLPSTSPFHHPLSSTSRLKQTEENHQIVQNKSCVLIPTW